MRTSREIMQRYNNNMSFLAILMLSILPLIAYSAIGVTASAQAQRSSSLLTPAKQNNNNINYRQQLRTRHLQNDGAVEEPSDTNDDGYTVVDTKAIVIQISGLSSSAIAKVQEEAVVIEIMKYLNEEGHDALMNSDLFSDRFFNLNVGMEYEWIEDSQTAVMAAEARSNTKPWDRNLRTVGHRILQTQTPTLDTSTAITQTLESNTTPNSNTATLILGQNGTITFHGSYWEDDPTSSDVTSFLVTELNKDETKLGLVNVIQPLVCTTDEIKAVDNGGNGGCDLNVKIVSSDALENGVIVDEESVETANTEEEVSPKVSEAEVTGTTDEEDVATEPIQTNTVNGVEESIPSDRSTDPTDENDSNSKWLIPVIVGSTLVALAIASLLFIKLRNNNDHEGQDGTEILKTTTTDDETEYRGDMGVEVTNEDSVLPPASWASRAYEAITLPTVVTRNRSSSSVVNRPKASAAAAAAVAGTAALEAEKKKTSSDTTLKLDDKAKKKTRNIDSILDDFSDGDSSFDDSSATSNSINTSVISGVSGLSGILEGTVPLDDIRTGSRLSNASTDDVNSGYANAGGGYLPKSLTKDLLNKTRSNVSNTSSTIRKQEEFEGAYRTRSAMAKLNLKKDILHVACDTHDAPTEVVDSEAATGGPSVPIIGSSAVAAGACSPSKKSGAIGVTRTISAKKNSTMLEKQRIAEKLTMKSYGKKNRKGVNTSISKDEDEEGSILPLNFIRSDSVISEEEDSI